MWSSSYDDTIKEDMDLRLLEQIGTVRWEGFDAPDGTPLAIETHLHLFSEHVAAAVAAGWMLTEMHEQVIDERWIAQKPKWASLKDVPVSFAAVWRR